MEPATVTTIVELIKVYPVLVKIYNKFSNKDKQFCKSFTCGTPCIEIIELIRTGKAMERKNEILQKLRDAHPYNVKNTSLLYFLTYVYIELFKNLQAAVPYAEALEKESLKDSSLHHIAQQLLDEIKARCFNEANKAI